MLKLIYKSICFPFPSPYLFLWDLVAFRRRNCYHWRLHYGASLNTAQSKILHWIIRLLIGGRLLMKPVYLHSFSRLSGTHEERRSISIVKDGKSRIWWGCKCRANSEEGGIQPKVSFASVLLPGNEFKEQRVNARQGKPPVSRRWTCCSSNGRTECGVSCVCSVNSFQVCSRQWHYSNSSTC